MRPRPDVSPTVAPSDPDSLKSLPGDVLTRRPLLGVALAALAGSALAFFFAPPGGFHAFFLLLAGAGVGWVGWKTGKATLLVYFFAAWVFWVHANGVLHPADPTHVLSLVEADRETLLVRGRIEQPPVIRSDERGFEMRFPLHLEELRRRGFWEPARGRMTVSWQSRTAPPSLAYGDRIEATGTLLTRQQRTRLPLLRIHTGSPTRLSRGHGNALAATLWTLRDRGRTVLSRGIEDSHAVVAVLHALVLGDRENLSDEQWDVFAESGMLHIFAISGLHVGVMAGLLIFVLRSLGVSRIRWGWFLIPLLGAYVVATGLQVSALRAWAMVSSYWLVVLLWRRPDTPTALALAFIGLLICDPRQLTNPGFILSFLIVGSLWLFVGPLVEPVREWSLGDPFRLQAEPLPVRIGRQIVLRLTELGVVSLVAWVVSLPLAALFFQRISLYAPLGNLVVVPFAFLVVTAGCLSLVFGLISPALAEVFNQANWLLVSGLLNWVDWVHGLPGSWIPVAAPSLWILAGFALFLVGWRLPTVRLRRVGVVAGAGLLLAGVLFRLADTRLEGFVYEGGGSQALFLETGRGEKILIDAGSDYDAPRLVRSLRRRGIRQLDRLIVTHAASSSYGGARLLMEEISVKEVWTGPDPGRSPGYSAFLAWLESENIPRRVVARGDQGIWGKDCLWKILHPVPGREAARASEGSLVIWVEERGTGLLYTGGSDGGVQQTLPDSWTHSQADLLIVGETEKRGILPDSFLYSVWPDHVILMTDGYSRGQDPARGVEERVRAVRATYWSTSRDGPVLFRRARSGGAEAGFRVWSRW